MRGVKKREIKDLKHIDVAFYIRALPSARAVRSYCTGLSHGAGIRCHP
jgi:hypothetical protein